MKIELNRGRSSDIAENRSESFAVLEYYLETGVPETLPAVAVALGPVRKPQVWIALKKTIPTYNQGRPVILILS
jgi:hypothetical protein